MSNGATEWRIAGDEVGSCNCIWACPCQFNANPTHGNCEALIVWQIREGHFGDLDMSGVRFGVAVHFPGPIHYGDGTVQLVVDEAASDEQREAIQAMASGENGGTYFEIFSSVCPNKRDPITASIGIDVDRDARRGTVRVDGVGEARIEPIVNPEIGPDEHRIRIDLPDGFEYKQAEIGNTVEWEVSADDPLSFAHEDTYAQMNAFDWSNA
jgi:hypothetical protein